MISESAPLTVDGSFSDSLTLSKLWMCTELKRILSKIKAKEFKQVYSLGSWYGNMALFMLMTHVPFKILVDVDKDKDALELSHKALTRLAPQKKIVSICTDCNQLKYFLTPPSLVINNSTNNMPEQGWFSNIPKGTIVALQSRSDEPNNRYNDCRTLHEFDRKYPLSSVSFVGELSLEDPGDSYKRWMKIGIK